MSTSDWVLVWSTLTLGVVAIFGAAWSDRFKAWVMRPALRISCRQAQPDCHLTQAQLRVSSSQVSLEPCYVYRLRIDNSGRSQARKCEIVLEALAIADTGGRYIPLAAFTPVRLVWGSGTQDQFVDINPGREYFCDFFKVPADTYQRLNGDFGNYIRLPHSPAGALGLELDVSMHYFSQPDWLPPGRYRFDVAAHSENADVTRASFYVSWSGQWRDALEDMYRECTLSQSAAT